MSRHGAGSTGPRDTTRTGHDATTHAEPVPAPPRGPRPGAGIALDPEWVAEKVRRTRAEQGLPETVQDPVALATAAALLRPLLERAA